MYTSPFSHELKSSTQSYHHGFECFPPDVQSLSRHAKKHHQEQLEKKDGILRRTEVEDPIVARFLRESHGQGPILVNATKKAIKVNFRSTRLNAMKTEDANELNLGGKAGPSAVGVNAGKKTRRNGLTRLKN